MSPASAAATCTRTLGWLALSPKRPGRAGLLGLGIPDQVDTSGDAVPVGVVRICLAIDVLPGR